MRSVGGLLALGLLLAGPRAEAANGAQPTPQPASEPAEQLNWQPGPQRFEPGHDVQIDLPAEYGFLGMPDAKKLMERMGNLYNENLLGVIAGVNDEPWFITVRYTEEGHVDDSEAIKPDELLTAIQKGTLEANKERVARGFSPAHVDGWDEQPTYDRAQHQLVWALTMKADNGHNSLNYSTRILGRRGYVALNLVTEPGRFATDRGQAAKMLAVTGFKVGARYEDFDKKKDKVAEYGLMGLILGGAGLGAAKLVKVGLLATFGKSIIAFLVALKKAVVLLFIGIWGSIKKLFGKKKTPTENVATGTAPQPPVAVEPKLTAEAKPPTGSEPPTDDFK